MPVCRRLKSALLQWLLILGLSSAMLPALADGISISEASIRLNNGLYVLDARLNYRLTKKAVEALSNGVQLNFTVSVRIKRERKYLWDPTLLSTQQRFRLEYHALSKQYLVTNQVTGNRRIFLTLGRATQHLGIINIPLADQSELADLKHLVAEFEAELDIESLPAPLRPIAYLTPEWHISSPSHRLEISQ